MKTTADELNGKQTCRNHRYSYTYISMVVTALCTKKGTNEEPDVHASGHRKKTRRIYEITKTKKLTTDNQFKNC